MIFVTVGNTDPFDRLVQAVDAWAGHRAGDEEILVQIGHGRYHPEHCRHVEFLTPSEFRETFSKARFVVSHAGMGTIISALELGKPLIVMPKRADLGEQRNDHQLATVRRFRRSNRILVAESSSELEQLLESLASRPINATTPETEWRPDESLIQFVREFIANSAVARNQSRTTAQFGGGR